MMLKIKLRRNQFKLSEKSASMAIWLGKQYLNQRDNTESMFVEVEDITPLAELLNNDKDENDSMGEIFEET